MRQSDLVRTTCG